MTQEEFSERFLSRLNKQQKEAVQTVDGAILLLAVPGSGKTTVLITRLGYMVCCLGIAPERILTTTYTVASTNEMRQRFGSLFGEGFQRSMEFRTINGLSAKIIDYYNRNNGKGQPFQLLDEDVVLAQLVGQIYQTRNNDYATESIIKDIRTSITYIKNMMLSEEEIENFDFGIPHMPEIYKQYCTELRSNKQMDYDDQMIYALRILERYPSILAYFQDQYRYICVDESQDTSKIQHKIIQLLANRHGNLFMVGDEDQSIYGFRAAYPDALLNFSNDYPNAKIMLLENNYRSTNEIVSVANAFVSKNRYRHNKSIVPTRGSGVPIQVIDAVDRVTQYQYLFTLAENCESETAILYRNNDSALPLIDVLERNGIPYNCRQFDGAFFSHRIVADIRDIIHFSYDPHDIDTFMRIYFKFGSPLSKKAAIYACEQSRRTGKSILEELIQFPELNSYAKEGAINLRTVLPMIVESGATKAIQLIWNTAGYRNYVNENKLDEGKLAILCILGEKEPSPRDLLRRLQELQDIIRAHKNRNSNKLVLSTIHSSKGLEYERVFLLDIFDGTLPKNPVPDFSSQDELKQYEEERRLYYVAMTRAKNELSLFHCRGVESAFTTEVLHSLPVEVLDADNIMALFQQRLCGKTYVHKENGKGTVVAQCGYSVLVEYEMGRFQLLTLSQLLEQREPTVTYEVARKSKAKNPHKRTEVRKMDISAQPPKIVLTNVEAGRSVTHSKFGKGVITEFDGTYAIIRFDEMVGEKTIDMAMAVQNKFILL
ncbi:MAG: ATP-dependent helicase [Clostridium sp.]|uniref:ATP-dependent helicase n=1 Tax=Clostridium sp. TaxID=1506 RepID=UPI00290AC77F|nr:ATP-dependent helicase [Clostridium sp.]MDU7336711.1 ATP-dependent helicase [Clostridium sp.]